MIYVYAIGGTGAAVEELGLDDRRVELARRGSLTAIVSRGLGSAVEPTPAALACHDRVVASAMESGPVLPMRFGTVLRDDGALTRAMAERAGELERRLERVRGRVELGVRAVWPGNGDRQRPRSGRDFLLAKLRQRSAAQQIVDQLHIALAEVAADARCTVLPRADTPLAGAYLVDRERVDTFAARARALGSECERAEIVLSGPWPPYSFSEAHDA